MTERTAGKNEVWPVSWEANRAAMRDSTSAATPAQRLAWLEDALRLAHRSGAVPVQEPDRRATRRAKPRR